MQILFILARVSGTLGLDVICSVLHFHLYTGKRIYDDLAIHKSRSG